MLYFLFLTCKLVLKNVYVTFYALSSFLTRKTSFEECVSLIPCIVFFPSHQWSKSGFQLAYKNSPHTRVCFYVNNRIATHSWSVQLPTPDLITMIIETKRGPVNVHNVYNPSPRSYRSTEAGTLEALRQQLRLEGQHVVVGDFNLHHPWWGDRSTQSA